MSAAELGAVTTTLFEEDIGAMRNTPGPGAVQAFPIAAFVEDLLGIKPEIIVRAWHENQRDADEAFARDPEGQVAAALAAWVMSILDLHRRVLAEQIETIRLLIVDDESYQGPANARYANVGAIFLAGFLAEGDDRDIAFLVPNAA